MIEDRVYSSEVSLMFEKALNYAVETANRKAIKLILRYTTSKRMVVTLDRSKL